MATCTRRPITAISSRPSSSSPASSRCRHPTRRFYELPLLRNESPAFALSWTLFHVIDERSPLYGLTAEDMTSCDVGLIVVVTGYDVVAAQTVHARKSYEHDDILFGQRYVDVVQPYVDGRVRIDYGRFHDTFEG
jgi:inward rectifier potassium channel